MQPFKLQLFIYKLKFVINFHFFAARTSLFIKKWRYMLDICWKLATRTCIFEKFSNVEDFSRLYRLNLHKNSLKLLHFQLIFIKTIKNADQMAGKKVQFLENIYEDFFTWI